MAINAHFVRFCKTKGWYTDNVTNHPHEWRGTKPHRTEVNQKKIREEGYTMIHAGME